MPCFLVSHRCAREQRTLPYFLSPCLKRRKGSFWYAEGGFPSVSDDICCAILPVCYFLRCQKTWRWKALSAEMYKEDIRRKCGSWEGPAPTAMLPSGNLGCLSECQCRSLLDA